MVTAPTEHWTKILLNPGPPNLRSKGRLSLCLWLAASTTVIPGWLPKVRAAPLPLHRPSQAPCELPPTRSRRPNSQRRTIVPHAHCSSAGSCRRSTPANLLPPCYRVSATHGGWRMGVPARDAILVTKPAAAGLTVRANIAGPKSPALDRVRLDGYPALASVVAATRHA